LVRRATQAGVDSSAASVDPSVVDEFRSAMDDDFNTPRALAAVFEASSRANRAIDGDDPEAAAALVATVVALARVLGIEVGATAVTDPGAEIDALVRERNEAREARDFARADSIRDQLAAEGVNLEDGPGGTTWHR
jgi:cysteinyl-tRNA synthetase